MFIKLWQHWQKIDHNKLGGWLLRLAHNAVIDHLRKQRPQQTNLDHYAEVDEQISAGNEELKLDQDLFARQLQVAIKSLEDPFRSIIIMRDIQDMSYKEIQGSLDISASQVKVYLHRARRKLRDNVELRQLFHEQKDDELESKQSVTATAISDKGNGHASQ